MDGPKRKPNRLTRYDYSTHRAYFVTICTEKKRPLFWRAHYEWANCGPLRAVTDRPYMEKRPDSNDVGANCVRPMALPLSDIGAIVDAEIRKMSAIYPAVRVDKYVIMPNHIHMIVVIETNVDGRTQFAPTLSRVIKQFKGSITKQIGQPIWQKSFYDHIIRNEKEYLDDWSYIDANPAKWAEDELFVE